MMSGRKRANPQRIDVQNEAKRISFYQYIPSLRETPVLAANQPNSDPAHIQQHNSAASVLEAGDSENNPPNPNPTAKKRRRKGKKKAYTSRKPKVAQSLPPPSTISEDTLAELPCVPFPDSRSRYDLVPILHSHTPGPESYQIQLSRSGHPDSICICLGKLCFSLEGSLPLNKLLSECGGSLKLYVEWSCNLPLLKIYDGVNCVYVSIQEAVLPLSSSGDLSKMCRLLCGKRFARLSIPPASEDAPLVSELVVEVWAMESLCIVSSPSEMKFSMFTAAVRDVLKMLQPGCLDNFHSQSVSDSRLRVSEQVEQFYRNVQAARRQIPSPSATVNPSSISGLSAELRGYQCRAVEWMLQREGVGSCEASEDGGAGEGGGELHKLWRRLPMTDQEVYFNPFSGKFSKQHFPVAPWPKGGILADEMGLGKTVEVLALVLSHPRSGEYSESRPDPHSMETEASHLNTEEELSRETHLNALPNGVGDQPDKSTDPAILETKEGSSEVVLCLCGANSDKGYEGEFVQCETCLVWFHSFCVDFSAERDGPHFYCVRCLLENPLPSGATLIISPQAIAQQWMDEIEKHTEPGAITAYMYRGVSRRKYISPLELARYDIVMVTYETLCTEFYHAMSHEMAKTLRKRKRYSYSPSPLPAVLWWRVCLDEAQMVESTNVRAAEMTKKLSAVNRWCVTGTPVQKQLLDLYGLVLFLNADPYCYSPWFSRLVWEPYLHGNDKPIVELFSKVMWRNSKADVASELCLPDHSEEVHWLQFSSVEEYFYERQQEKCRSDLEKVISGLCNSSTLSSLVQATFNKLMTPLHSLRQACCHPQLVRSGSYLPTSLTNKSFITMPRLLEKLTAQAKVEAREALRQLVAALNGQAAIYIEHDEFDWAVSCYREAMTVWQEHLSHDVDCDKLQRIHTMENLAEVLEYVETGTEGGHTLRDDTLVEEAAALRSQYTEKVEGQVKAAAEGLFVVKNNITFAQRELNWRQADFLEEISPELVEEVTQTSKTTDETGDQTTVEQSSGDQTKPSTEGVQAETTTDVDDPNQIELTINQPESEAPTMTAIDQSELDDTADQSQAKDSSNQSESEAKDHSSSTTSSDQSEGSAATSQSPSKSVGDHSEGEHGQADRGENGGASNVKQKLPPPVKKPKPDITPSQSWWVSVCSWCDAHDLDENLLAAVNQEFEPSTDTRTRSLTHSLSFRNLTGISYYLTDNADKTQTAREAVLSLLDELCATPTYDIVEHASSCHLRRQDSEFEEFEREPCPVCVAESKIISYERQLFSEYDRETRVEHSVAGEGSRRPGAMERIMKILLLLANRQKGAPKKLLEAGQAFLSYLDLMKKEYAAIRILWLNLDGRLRAHDELNMASTRLRVLSDDEAEFDFSLYSNDPFAVHPNEVMFMLRQFEGEKQFARQELKKCLGQVLYLKNLAKKNDSSEEKTESCPVCDLVLDSEWAVFSCGHPLCVECTAALTKHRQRHCSEPRVTIKCPLCREPSISNEINYVRVGVASEESQDIPVQGCHSTKIAAVVRTLLYLQRTEPGAKSLVFSAWMEVLDLVGLALERNKIKYDFLKTKATFQDNLTHFKTSLDSNILLLPFHSGSKGLNIVEATHVLLVEPLLNMGAEQQAIGRVYRMGQTRPTKVHRFLVKKTVEENIFNLFNSQPDKARLLSSKEKESELTLEDVRALVGF